MPDDSGLNKSYMGSKQWDDFMSKLSDAKHISKIAAKIQDERDQKRVFQPKVRLTDQQIKLNAENEKIQNLKSYFKKNIRNRFYDGSQYDTFKKEQQKPK